MRASAVRVRTETIDALVGGGMAAPDFIKIDVEGAEGAVIRGAARTIDAQRPMMLIEVHSPEAGREVAAAMPCRYTFQRHRDGDRGRASRWRRRTTWRGQLAGPERTPSCA